jgi:hypothetical protein
MKLKKIILFVTAAIVLGLSACKKFNDHLDSLLSNPSVADQSAASVDLYLNNLQLNFESFFQAASDLSDPLTRQEIMYGPTYFNAYAPTSFDGIWGNAYTSIFLTANTLIPLAEEKSEFVHAGIAKTLKAYTMVTMVDLFGDIPYSQADQGVVIPNPEVDKGADVYDSALVLLDSAIADFGLTSLAQPSNDLFYGGSATKWRTLAKTLKLKIYMQTRLVDNSVAAKITDLVNENDLINSSSQDFVFNFSTHNQAPDSRAPHYVGNYGTDNGAGDYMGNYFMWLLYQEKGIVDPRIRYYIYRQIDDATDLTDSRLPDQTTLQFALACYYRAYPANYPPTSNPTIGFTTTPYCIVGKGYWGRDHGNNEGIGPDNSLRSTWGLYPAGGAFDANQNKAIGQSTGRINGAGGDGILPIWLSSYTYFLEAEAALILGTPGDPETLLTQGVNASFNKVKGFAASIGYTLPTSDTTMLITTSNQQNYVNKVKSLYEAAGSQDAQLNVIMKEYYLAAWGNGLETYNNYRRTGKPDNMQPALNPDPGLFIRSFFYASVYVNYNKNAVQKTTTNVKVFWDTHDDSFLH